MTDAITIRDIKRLAENDSTAAAARVLALLNNFQDKLAMVADNTALKAIGSADRADKFLAYKEDSQQLFAYDSTSIAGEALGPPATVVAPTGIGTGAGRWLALTLGGSAATKSYVDGQDTATQAAAIASALATLNQRLRAVGDENQVKALDVATLADKCIVYVEDLKQFFGYDAIAVDAEDLGPPIRVIAPTAGAGRYLALTFAPGASTWTVESQATDPAAGDELPVTADGTFANCNRMLKRIPTAGILKVWYVGAGSPAGIDDANTSVFKIIKADGTALITKTFNTATQPGAAYVPTLLGTCTVAEGDVIGWEAVNGAAADLPAFSLQFDLTPVG